ncbi:MAG: Maf family nucleotide pyrophosphatase [Tannerella sp.]|jgi:septum formation protein|nr:Maf family nucleotide pyrophosphatase [Tannerella sp.]
MLEKYHIILASNSPRRKELLKGLGLDFEVCVIPGIDESYPADIPPDEVPCYIALKKSKAYNVSNNELIITADTVVILDNVIIEKPNDREDAIQMLHRLSGHSHEVITGVVISTQQKQVSFSVKSTVSFATLTDEEITYYVDTFQPYDKAGAYGIQEWIGYIGVQGINGSFYNVMGLPVQRLYQELKQF